MKNQLGLLLLSVFLGTVNLEAASDVSDVVNEIKRIRLDLKGELDALKRELQDATDKISNLEQKLEETSPNSFPIGSIYVEYYNQANPQVLWPNTTWQDVTSSYSGQFFRAYGGGSGSWGAVQLDCAPRITKMAYIYSTEDTYNYTSEFPTSGWSPFSEVGVFEWPNSNPRYFEALRFYTENCEVRPINQAIRLWKRIA